MADSYLGYAPADRLYLANASVDNAALAASVITGQTALGAAPAAADVLLVYDDSASTLKKVTYANFGGDIAGVTAGTGLNGGGSSGDVTVNLDTTLPNNTVISTSGAITTTGAFTSIGIDDNADALAITIDSSEKVGIGTASPGAVLHTTTASGDIARLYSTQAGTDAALRLSQSATNSNAGIFFENTHGDHNKGCGIRGAGSLEFCTGLTAGQSNYGANVRMTVDATGEVGIGQTVPTGKLHVKSAGASSTPFRLERSGGSGDELAANMQGDNRLWLQMYQAGTEKIRFDVGSNSFITNNLGLGTTTPNKLLHLLGGDMKLEGTTGQKEFSFKNTSSAAPHGNIAYYDNVDTKYWTIGSNIRVGPGWEVNEGAGQGVNRFNIAPGGNVGIGTDTTAPAKQFEITKSAVARITALSDGATITPDFNTAQNFSVTLAGNRTLANPSNITAGQTGSIFVTQDGTGGRTLAFGSYWDFIAGTAPTMTTTASAVDRIDYIVRTATSIEAVVTLAYS